MKKTLNILSLVFFAIAAISLLLLTVFCIFQKQLMSLYTDMRITVSVVPVVQLVSIFIVCGILFANMFTVASKKIGLWSECIYIGVLAVIRPSLVSLLSFIQSTYLSKGFGSIVIAAYSTFNSICKIPLAIADFSVMCTLVLCGMSIVYKYYLKKNRYIIV